MGDCYTGLYTTEFLSTPSARRATLLFWRRCRCRRNFYPRPPRGGRPSCRRWWSAWQAISIHALREEGDGSAPYISPLSVSFLSTPSARRATQHHSVLDDHDEPFLSTPSARRATPEFSAECSWFPYFYPRPPRGGRRAKAHWTPLWQMYFYPRPPRGGRRCQPRPGSRPDQFLSTPSARRATQRAAHAEHSMDDFYPRPPRGGRRLGCRLRQRQDWISIHALREEGDVSSSTVQM